MKEKVQAHHARWLMSNKCMYIVQQLVAKGLKMEMEDTLCSEGQTLKQFHQIIERVRQLLQN